MGSVLSTTGRLLFAVAPTAALVLPHNVLLIRETVALSCYLEDVSQCIAYYQPRIESCAAINLVSSPYIVTRSGTFPPDGNLEHDHQPADRYFADGCLCATYKDMMKCFGGCEGSDEHVAMGQFLDMFCGT